MRNFSSQRYNFLKRMGKHQVRERFLLFIQKEAACKIVTFHVPGSVSLGCEARKRITCGNNRSKFPALSASTRKRERRVQSNQSDFTFCIHTTCQLVCHSFFFYLLMSLLFFKPFSLYFSSTLFFFSLSLANSHLQLFQFSISSEYILFFLSFSPYMSSFLYLIISFFAPLPLCPSLSFFFSARAKLLCNPFFSLSCFGTLSFCTLQVFEVYSDSPNRFAPVCAPPARFHTVWVHIHHSSGRQKILKEFQKHSWTHLSTKDFSLSLSFSYSTSYSFDLYVY